MPGQDTWYSGDAQAVRGRDSLRRLKQLPVVQIDSGYVRVLFRTDDTVTWTGFAFRYFAKARYMGNYLCLKHEIIGEEIIFHFLSLFSLISSFLFVLEF